jgi:hypothetical protein
MTHLDVGLEQGARIVATLRLAEPWLGGFWVRFYGAHGPIRRYKALNNTGRGVNL